jgi:hypothetical protein
MKYVMGIVLLISGVLFLLGHLEVTQTRIGMIYLWLAWLMCFKKDNDEK